MSVAIVGAGPGDPGLITVRALELVRRMPDPRLRPARLSGALRRGNPGDPDPARGALAGAGERDPGPARPPRPAVVRLKGGDPFVFGRGAEEVAALEAAGVPYEVVPGVSTLTALPGLSGIPLTPVESPTS